MAKMLLCVFFSGEALISKTFEVVTFGRGFYFDEGVYLEKYRTVIDSPPSKQTVRK